MFLRRLTVLGILGAGLLLNACGGSGAGSAGPAPAVPVAANPGTAELSVLMFGNSHTVSNQLPQMLAAMLRAGRPGKTVEVVAAPGYATLEQRMTDNVSRAQLDSRKWSALVLQGQAYSSSGEFDYSITDAVEWVRLARLKGTLPVMFPEWPRRGVNETARIYELHARIARVQPACVAPIPQAWDLSLARHPALVLHADDGNHSNPAGAFLAALVLYSSMTGESPQALPAFAQFPITAELQANLRKIADDQVKLVSPGLYCPGDNKL